MTRGTNNLKGPGPGRPKGMKQRDVTGYLELIGFDVIAEVVKRYNDPKLPTQTHDKMLDLLIKRVAPELKSVEHTDRDGNPLEPTVINLILSEKQPKEIK